MIQKILPHPIRMGQFPFGDVLGFARLICIHFLLPLANGEDNDGEYHAHDPGEHQRSKQCNGLAVGVFRTAGQISNEVSNGNTNDNGGNNGDPHRGHRVTCAAHDTTQHLRHRNADIAHGHEPDHAGSKGDQLRGTCEEAKEDGTQKQQNQGD